MFFSLPRFPPFSFFPRAHLPTSAPAHVLTFPRSHLLTFRYRGVQVSRPGPRGTDAGCSEPSLVGRRTGPCGRERSHPIRGRPPGPTNERAAARGPMPLPLGTLPVFLTLLWTSPTGYGLRDFPQPTPRCLPRTQVACCTPSMRYIPPAGKRELRGIFGAVKVRASHGLKDQTAGTEPGRYTFLLHSRHPLGPFLAQGPKNR